MSKFNKIFAICLFVLFLLGTSALAEDINPAASLTYRAHVSNIGWQSPVKNGETAGTTGKAQQVEALVISTNLDPAILGVSCTPHIQNTGWTAPVGDNTVAGTEGKGLALEALRLSLTGSQAPNYTIFYRVHSANFGWLGWASNGETAGTTNCAFPIEAIEIQILPAGSSAPGSTSNAYLTPNDIKLSVRTHVQNIGWTAPVPGSVSGTTGKALNVEAVEAKVTDPLGTSGVIAQAHVGNDGWQNHGNPNDAVGTTGQNKKIEALNFGLKGAAAKLFDINYRVHVRNLGWMPWTANGQNAGTTSANLGVEAVDIILKPKGTAAVQAGAYKAVQTPCGIIPPAKTSIVISINRQHMTYYENYDVVADTGVVTGLRGVDDTKKGDWKVEEKVPYFRTVGPGYDMVVNYWLTLYQGDIYGFNGEGHIIGKVGIHDNASRSIWGPTAYLRNGSHGCVNTPFEPMKTIFTRVPVGAPVKIR